MKYSEQFKASLDVLKTGDANADNLSRLNNAFWSMLIEEICTVVRESGDLIAFLKTESKFIDFGLCPELLSDLENTNRLILEPPEEKSLLDIFMLSSWLSERAAKIMQGDRKELLEKEVQFNGVQNRKIQSDIGNFQSERCRLLQKALTEKSPQHPFLKQIDCLIQNDNNLLESIRTKKAISLGSFLSVEKKREHFNREKMLQKETERIRSVIDSLQGSSAEIKSFSDQINDLFNQMVELEQATVKLNSEIEEIQKKQQQISVQEIESRIRSEIEYIRDLTRLSARRLHFESCPVIQDGKKSFTIKKIAETLNHILEFDPKLLRNDRVGIFGKPGVLLVPGSGNALYDWKNNLIIVPVNLAQGDYLSSIASGVIEYRLDVDEDKTLLTSYNQLPEMKAIRSTLQLRTHLVKDYITWMTSEYAGYRILPKSIKEWFEREIAPSRNDIFTPYKYSLFTMTSAESKALSSKIESKLQSGVNSCTDEELWAGSVLYYQQGNFARSFEMLTALAQKKSCALMVYYNIGQVASKLHKKLEAIDGYQKFLSGSPQSWWTRLAQDHIRRLQIS